MTGFAEMFKVAGINPRDYIYKFALPILLIFVLSSFILNYFSSIFPFFILPLLGLLIILFYPKVVYDRKRILIDQNLHMFITHISVLSTAEVNRADIFETIAKKKDYYQEIAVQAEKIVKLIKDWGMSLPEACKFQAKRCPSKIFKDFLERLAYNVDAGQQLDEFLIAEQDVLMGEFETMYKNSLKDVDIFKDLFLSMILSIAFAVVFATILPALTGSDPMLLLIGTLILFTISESGFLYAMYVRVPKDPLWSRLDKKPEMYRKLNMALILSVVGILAIAIVFALFFGGYIKKIPLLMNLSILLSPLIFPGFISRKYEKMLRERDKNFPSFIRSLGSAETVKQTTTVYALKTLQNKDFGALTKLVKDLYRRLNMRFDNDYSWKIFIRDASTFLIHRFTEMYVDARLKGGIAEKIGDIIAKNCEKIVFLRMYRTQTTTTLIGVLYGITASLAFALFIGVRVVDMMCKSLSVVSMPGGVSISIINLQLYKIPEVTFIISMLLVIHSLLSSMMIKVVDGGHMVNAFFHYVVMLWIASLSAFVTEYCLGNLISIGNANMGGI